MSDLTNYLPGENLVFGYQCFGVHNNQWHLTNKSLVFVPFLSRDSLFQAGGVSFSERRKHMFTKIEI